MDDRKLQILGAIVEDYVSTREPVGSKSLLERHELGVSAATVRNDMSVLEEEGLIHQPHTSAGRVPTDKGYRAFVDHVAMVKPLSAAEKRAIRTLLEDAGDVEELLARTVRLLAQLTQQVAMVQYPARRQARIRHVELVKVADSLLLVVLIYIGTEIVLFLLIGTLAGVLWTRTPEQRELEEEARHGDGR